MSAFATLTLANATPTNHDFLPIGIDAGNIAKWQKSESVFDARPAVTFSVTHPKAGGQVVRIKAKVTLPIMDTTDTSLKLGECIANVEYVLPKRATSTQRLDLNAYTKSLLAHASMTAAVTNLEGIY